MELKKITFFGPKIWDLVPLKIKQKAPLNTFKNTVMTETLEQGVKYVQSQ